MTATPTVDREVYPTGTEGGIIIRSSGAWSLSWNASGRRVRAKTIVAIAGDRWFESSSLQRGVRCETTRVKYDGLTLGPCRKGYVGAAHECGVEQARPDQQLDQSRIGFRRGKGIGSIDQHPDLPAGAAQLYRHGQDLGFVIRRARQWSRCDIQERSAGGIGEPVTTLTDANLIQMAGPPSTVGPGNCLMRHGRGGAARLAPTEA